MATKRGWHSLSTFLYQNWRQRRTNNFLSPFWCQNCDKEGRQFFCHHFGAKMVKKKSVTIHLSFFLYQNGDKTRVTFFGTPLVPKWRQRSCRYLRRFRWDFFGEENLTNITVRFEHVQNISDIVVTSICTIAKSACCSRVQIFLAIEIAEKNRFKSL